MIIAAQSPSFRQLDGIKVDHWQTFADLCSTTAAEDDRFMLVCVAIGTALALISVFIYHFFRQEREGSWQRIGCTLAAALAVLLAIASFWLTGFLFPDPRDNVDICGHTPDSIFLPIVAGIIVPLSFAIILALLSAFARPRKLRS